MNDDPPDMPEAWGSYAEWRSFEQDGREVILRTGMFSDKHDAWMYHLWCEADYKLRNMQKPETKSHEQKDSGN